MGWQDDARKTIVSEKKMLTTMEGYWVKVRKFSIKGNDEIEETKKQAQKSLDKKALYEVAKAVKGIEPEKLKNMGTDEVIAILTPDQFSVLTESSNMVIANTMEAKLKNGIDSHNFCEGDIDSRSTDKNIKEFAVQIMNYPEIAGEIVAFVEEFNRPLAKVTSKTSGMSQNGSTGGQSLNSETLSQMGETLPN